MLTEKDYCDYDTCVAFEELGCPINSLMRLHLYDAQKWLREKKGINVLVMQITIEGSGMRRYASYIQLDDKIWLCRYYSLYEEALLEGIKEAVKLIKEK